MKEVCGPHTPGSLGFPRELTRAQHGLAGQASQAGQTGAKLGLAHGGRQVLVEMSGVGVGHPTPSPSSNTCSTTSLGSRSALLAEVSPGVPGVRRGRAPVGNMK